MAKSVTGKQRASRIPLDYYKGRDGIGKWKLTLSFAGILVPILWLATGFSLGGPSGIKSNSRGRMRYSRGPVSQAHAVWDAKCDACHDPNGSVGGESWPGLMGFKVGDANARCSTCHQVAAHAENLDVKDEGKCASCHIEHQGRVASLVAVVDAKCVSCHGNLAAHVKAGGASKLDPKITGFPEGHQEFRLLRDKAPIDTGVIKFNHALHMTAGFNDAKGGRPLLALGQLSDADRARYQHEGETVASPVRLECASCHQRGGDGPDFRPIAFQTDCAACHKLDVPLAAGPPSIVNASRADAKATKATAFRVPHGLQPEAIRALLRNAAIGEAMKGAQTPPDADRPLPGRTPSVLSRFPSEADVARRVGHAERILFGRDKGTCTECHSYQSGSKVVPEIAANANLSEIRVEGSTPGGHAAMMNALWFERSRFDHAAHRGVSCRECHSSAYPDDKSPSRSQGDVMLVGLQTCAKCHATERTDSATGLLEGGASSSCVECHRYHGARHGRTNSTTIEGQSIRDFLLGEPKKSSQKP